MIGQKKRRDIQRDLAKVLADLPSATPDAWFDREIKAAKGQPGRDLETLKMLKASLKRAAKKKRSKTKLQATR